jgi:hypothetical protein
MEKSIIINSKEYKIPELKFSTIVAMERAGVNFTNESSPFNFSFQIFKFFSKLDEKTASKELDEHFENGGSFDALSELTNDVNNFFITTQKHKK